MPNRRRCIDFLALTDTVTGARNLPDFLRILLVQCDNISAIAVQQLQIQPIAVQDGSRVDTAVLKNHLAVAVLDIDDPNFVAGKVKAGQVAGTEKEVSPLSVSAR
jgi:hypothetical protein